MRILISIPLLVILIAFALSNQGIVRLGLWPTDIELFVPLSVAVLAAAGVFFIVGAFMTWGGSLSLRSRARRAEQTILRLEAQIEASRSQQMLGRPAGPMMPPPR